MSAADVVAAAVFAVPTLAVIGGAVRDWRALPSARDTQTMDRHRQAMEALDG